METAGLVPVTSNPMATLAGVADGGTVGHLAGDRPIATDHQEGGADPLAQHLAALAACLADLVALEQGLHQVNLRQKVNQCTQTSMLYILH